ncbi:hypothetical protein [uncultured Psychroserpens sp.]|uniref:hypothetical protein n=1 Tax=uncultured Psychroserpens sp. TaxID=255436 RepID=UPI0026102E05|nr:hypothetical protein [uncultured Psychroserpens sp.]
MNWDKFYILIFDNNGIPKTFNQKVFHNNLTQTKGVKAWWHYLESTYIIKVGNSVNASHIVELMKELAPNKKYFTSEINFQDYNGWLPNEAWDWIKENTKHNNV